MNNTPGPWRVNPRSTTKVITKDAIVVAQAFDSGGDGETARANALLIAAAPEMLQILHVLLGYAESKSEDGGKRPLAHMFEARTLLATLNTEGTLNERNS